MRLGNVLASSYVTLDDVNIKDIFSRLLYDRGISFVSFSVYEISRLNDLRYFRLIPGNGGS